MTSAGRFDDAQLILAEALREQPNGARANLLNARLLAARGDPAQAAVYYHRAIYGAWTGDATVQRLEARLELIRQLAQRGERKQLLAELLPVEAETDAPAIRREVAALYITAGSPARAADEYRELIALTPNDPALLTGLGHAELASGRYGAAQVAFLRAYRLAPTDSAVRHGMELTSSLTALDPTPRRLPSREKYERSRRILQLVRGTLSACAVPLPDVPVPPRNDTNEAAEQQLQQAEQLWAARPAGCAAPEIVSLILDKLAAQ